MARPFAVRDRQSDGVRQGVIMRQRVLRFCLAAFQSVALASCLGAAPLHNSAGVVQASTARSADDAFLDGLVGVWRVDGGLGGQPAHYRAVGRRILAGAWLEFSLIDTASPPGYQADVLISADNHAHDYVAHWL